MEDVNTPKRQLVVVSLTSSSPQISCQLEAHYTIFPRIRSGNGVMLQIEVSFHQSIAERGDQGEDPSSAPRRHVLLRFRSSPAERYEEI